ncbi:MAG TPA: DUF3097 domain-containing protein [Pseudolysinimonas sp.]|nr:DUF3097 domain-containing protein [Pseudolysinimonas sp.]
MSDPSGFGGDRYGSDVLASARAAAAARTVPTMDAEPGLVVELTDGGWVGAVVRVEKQTVELEDRHGRRRVFPLGTGFLVDGAAVRLRVPLAAPARPRELRTASGSVAPAPSRARVARASRIFVEGRHDAELVEKVWGADLRVEGVVVEYLEGVDHLVEVLREVRPGPERRIGVLVDHLVPGSKESRIAAQVAGAHVLVVGHPFVDVWQGVKPARLGLESWPVIPMNVEWKHGICAALGWPDADQTEIAAAWQRILASVRDYRDLEPALLGRVEQLIDFTTTP